MGNTVAQEIKEGWEPMVPKVIIVAEEERDNQSIEALLSTAPDNISNGNLLGCCALIAEWFHRASFGCRCQKHFCYHHRIVCLVPVSYFLRVRMQNFAFVDRFFQAYYVGLRVHAYWCTCALGCLISYVCVCAFVTFTSSMHKGRVLIPA